MMYPKTLCRIVAALFLAMVPARAQESTAQTVITTVAGERFIGTVAAEGPDFVRLISKSLGEVRIPRASISTMTRGAVEGPVAGSPAAAPAATAAGPAAAAPPKKGLIQSRLGLPGRFDATVGLGLLAQSGNFEQSTWSSSLDVHWEVGANVFNSSMQHRRQSVHGQVVDDGVNWSVRQRRNLSPKVFLLAAGDYREDMVTAVERESVLFFGPGFNFVKTPRVQVTTVVGPAYLQQRYLAGPGAPAPASLSDVGAVLYQTVNYVAAPRVKLSASVLLAQSLEDRAKHIATLMFSLDLALSETLSLSNSYSWQRDSVPRVGIEQHQGSLSTQLKLRL